jgi:hypothetical protein
MIHYNTRLLRDAWKTYGREYAQAKADGYREKRELQKKLK